ncbi:MAG: methyl-accepting chemotaxis protein [Oscillospiraceae bacterium]|nr:methyl-accepting chemotaxis protein [Oscillospiraceae bacterium]
MKKEKIDTNASLEPEQILKINLWGIVGVSAVFSVLNLLTHDLLPTVLILIMAAISTVTVLLFGKHLSIGTKIGFVTTAQFLIIFIVTYLKQSAADMFILFLASAIMCGIYMRRTVIRNQIVMINIATVIVFATWTLNFSAASISEAIKGAAAMEIGLIFLYLIVKSGKGFVRQAEKKGEEAHELLAEVKEKMEETERMAAKQQQLMQEIKVVADNMGEFSDEMLEISGSLTTGASEQQQALQKLAEETNIIVNEVKESSKATDTSDESTHNAVEKLQDGNKRMQEMLQAMRAIHDTSTQIGKVIKTIEDIAFQTNILALNAAVEAARAGAAGKGFAVVADEVRNLANKSAQAAKDTTALIESAISAVGEGEKVADTTAVALEEVGQEIEKTRGSMQLVLTLAEQQRASLESLQQSMDVISGVVSKNGQTAGQSEAVSQSLAQQVRQIQNAMERMAYN